MTFDKVSVAIKSNSYNDEREYFVFGKRDSAEYFAEREQKATVDKYIKDGETPVRFWTPSMHRCGVAVPSLFIEHLWTVKEIELTEPMVLGQDCYITAYFKPDGDDNISVFASEDEATKAMQSSKPAEPQEENNNSINAENTTETKSTEAESRTDSIKLPQIIKTLVK